MEPLLDWPTQVHVPDSTFHRSTDAVLANLDSQTPRWELPLRRWMTGLGAWLLPSVANLWEHANRATRQNRQSLGRSPDIANTCSAYSSE